MRRFFSITCALTLVASSLALAAPKRVNMPVGQSTTLAMPAPVSRVVVTDPELLDVSREGRRVTLTGRNTGTTEVVVTTADGETHLQIYVAADKYGMPH
ncbi:MAG: pilus assembly protein N-terminal domain-containing protein [Myxococcaceae bacterium]